MQEILNTNTVNPSLLTALILLPLIGFIINFFFGNKLPKSVIGILGSGIILVNFIIVCSFFLGITNGSISESSEINLSKWINVPDASIPFNIPFGFLIDRLSIMMLLIITGIGFLIHVYSIGYMHDDKGYFRFFAYLNLFIFFMQLLVTGSNYLVLFIGWEGVGLCSYLLIGFWFKNQEYNNAAKKAFIMNRIGDLGFLIGLFWVFEQFNSITFSEVFPQAQRMLADGTINSSIMIFITILFFIGATGKSAQLPLFTWLPDAMAGPTPVSALIHAATMVTAGIYLCVRSHVFFALAPFTSDIILYVGLATALFAGTIGIAQNDIKKVLAYSTVSQLGFMFVAVGLGAYSTAMFHLTTHAFFKALMFLGSGSVIHAMGGEQDIRKMGGLKSKMPITFITFWIGCLAISGIAPFAGFFSKDEILAKAFEHNTIVWGLLLLASLITAFYMFRLLFLTFHGSFRGTHDQEHHLHESPATMTFPLIVLGVLSLVGGFIGLPAVFSSNHALNNYLEPVLKDLSILKEGHEELSHSMELTLMAIAMSGALIMLFWCFKKFTKSNAVSMAEPTGFTKVLANKYYVDEIYDAIIVRPFQAISKFLYNIFDKGFIDAMVDATGYIVSASGNVIRKLQTGNVGFYLFAMTISALILILFNNVLSHFNF